MPKILMIIYYDFAEPILSAKNSLEKLGCEVYKYSLLEQYNADKTKTTYYKNLVSFIKNLNPTHIIWWCFSVPAEHIEYVRINNPNIPNYLYNWDDPFCWNDKDYSNKVKCFDKAFVSSTASFDKYKSLGSEPILLYPGFNKNIHYPIENHLQKDIDEYSCDISICCTNLYANKNVFNNQIINRKELVDKIYEHRDKFKFNIYGPASLKQIYPDCYKKSVHYIDTNKVFNYSKINICTHVTNETKYLNERVILILASGGILYVDNVKNLHDFVSKNNCIVINNDDCIEQILEILNNYDSCKSKLAGSVHNIINYDWDYWGKIIVENL